MQRTFNYTDRSGIKQHEALFGFSGSDDEIPEFHVKFNLETAAYPENADLYVEAHHGETRQRFYFGKINNISPPANRKLNELDLTGPTKFRVMIVDPSGKHGLLLASGDNFRGDADDKDENNKSSLLTVKTSPHLGQTTWKVEFDTGGGPELYFNSSIPSAIQKMREDPLFQSLVLPAALRQILMYYLWAQDEENEYYKRWMDFAHTFAEELHEESDTDVMMKWIDEIVTGFCTRFDLCDRLINYQRKDME